MLRLSCLQVNATPVLTFQAGTVGFCKRTSPAESAMTLMYGLGVSMSVLLSPATLDKFHYFDFYKVCSSRRYAQPTLCKEFLAVL